MFLHTGNAPNEYYFAGSLELAARTGAEVWPADARWDYQYERAAAPGRSWRAAAWWCRLKCIPSPLPGTQRASIGSVKLPQDAGLGEAGGILGGMAGWKR